MNDLGKWMVIVGCFLAGAGGLIWLGSKLGLPFGQFPGDVRISRENFTFYFPLISCLVASIVLTILINVFLALFRK